MGIVTDVDRNMGLSEEEEEGEERDATSTTSP